MDDPAAALSLATVGIVVLLGPALALFFGGIPSRAIAPWLAAIAAASAVIATIEWMLFNHSPAVAVFQGALAAVATLTVASVGLRAGHPARLAVALGAWLVAVLVPLGYSLFDIDNGPIVRVIGTLDFAGACVIAVVPGTAAIALALAHRWFGVAVVEPPRRPAWLLACCAVAAAVGLVAVSIGAELVLDATTAVLLANAAVAAVGGAIGWTAAQIANTHTISVDGVVSGVLAGSVVVLPASPWLQPVAVLVLSVIAAALGHVTTMAFRSRSSKEAWAPLIGVLLVPGSVGMVGAGIVAAGPGLLYSGHADLAEAQLQGLGLVLAVSFIAMLAVASIVFAVARRRVSAARR